MKSMRMKFFVLSLANFLIGLLIRTCRFKIVGLEKFVETARNEPTLLGVWHNRIAIGVQQLNRFCPHLRFVAFVSKSRDGELLSRVALSYPNWDVIRVAHDNRKGALGELVKNLKEKREVVVVTPDGPRGPRYQVKGGIAIAASETGVPVFTVSWAADRYWELGTWDRMMLPKPFAKITVVFGAPVQLGGMEREEAAKKIQEELLERNREADEMVERE